ncbi:ABC type transporter, permease component [Leptotrichia trevisanii]|jgi:hypothetical protein|uniref:ABC type transporter, permease component n=1 Tax=Leptotrichia trevisanii TaxID=109328 RepID=A0A510KHA3_9FUSO|nr:hypothetical protein [Leptotrichia trevisanii]BBM51072.1 ABC type transporter, permease component [Leptotrichia trevisanii]BBM56072.1 ABC type transporter, permease component [Leptotrichia trevisanii]
MKEINESLKNENLTQKEYFIKSFAVLKEMFSKDRKYLPSIIALFALSGYTMFNSFEAMIRASVAKQPFPKLPLSAMLINLLIVIVIEYALNLFQNDVITRIDEKNELTRKDILSRSIILAIIMTFISNFIKPLGIVGIGVLFALAYFAAFFRQIYLSRNVSLTTAFEKNTALLEGNRVKIILPLFLINVISAIVSAVLTTAASIIVLKSPNSAMIVIIILIISRILIGIFEIYKKTLASVIFLNVENNK